MAKPKTKPEPAVNDPLGAAASLIMNGHYPKARAVLRERLADPQLPEAQRERAKGLLSAMRIEQGVWMTLAGGVGLYLLAVLVAVLKQPH